MLLVELLNLRYISDRFIYGGNHHENGMTNDGYVGFVLWSVVRHCLASVVGIWRSGYVVR